jgi:hypothetical protein
MFALYLAHGCLGRFISWAMNAPKSERAEWLNLSTRQGAGLCAAMALAFLLTWLLGPFGFENFTHGEKIRGSEVFRGVQEWKSLLEPARFPPVWRVWSVIGVGIGSVVTAGVLAALLTRPRVVSTTRAKPPTRPIQKSPSRAMIVARTVIQSLALYDLAMIGIGLGLTLWARRFAPILFIFGAPALAALVLAFLRRVDRETLGPLRWGLMSVSWVIAGVVVGLTVRDVRETLLAPARERPHATLLDLVTDYAWAAHDSIQYLKRNELSVNLMTEWTQGGPVMFYAPNARLFMDGRAQQVFDEATYRDMEIVRYVSNPQLSRTERERARRDALRVLDSPTRANRMPDRARTDAVLIRRGANLEGMRQALAVEAGWVAVGGGSEATLYVRRDSEAFRAIEKRRTDGREWRPPAWTAATRPAERADK